VVQASTLKILAGHGVVEAAKQAGETQITATVVDCTDEEALAILVDDNELARHAEDDRESLAELLADLHETEFAPLSYNDDEVEDLLRELTMPRMGEADGLPHQSLVDRFGVPPFSVLDARQGYWQERKRGWLALGLRSELGRGGNLQGMSDSNDEYAYHKQEYFARQGRA
jgi:hypothetical protein